MKVMKDEDEDDDDDDDDDDEDMKTKMKMKMKMTMTMTMTNEGEYFKVVTNTMKTMKKGDLLMLLWAWIMVTLQLLQLSLDTKNQKTVQSGSAVRLQLEEPKNTS